MQNKDYPKLRECPHCGGEADCNDTGCQDYKRNPLWWVECLGCGISTSGSKVKEKAISEWNRRADHSGEANKMVSNADRIRSMGDEELALFLAEVEYRRSAFGGGAKWKCADSALDWLRQPAKEETE